MNAPTRFITISEFCKIYGFTKDTVNSWRAAGKLRWTKLNGRVLVADPGIFENLTATTAPHEIRDKDKFPMVRGTEVAAVLGISPRRLRELADKGRIGYRRIGRNRRYSMNDIRELLAYREARKALPPGDSTVPKPTRADRSRVVIAWVKQQLAQSA